MDRQPHKLTKTKRGLEEMRFLLFDTETSRIAEDDKTITQKFRLASSQFIQNTREYGVVTEPIKEHYKLGFLIHEILAQTRANKELHILSNNIWFDIRVSKLLPILNAIGYTTDFFHTKGTCVILKLSKGNRKIMFLNLFQFIPASVAKMGEVLGYEKLDFDFENPDDKECMIYCKRDTEIISRMFKLYLEYIREHKLGKMALTLAGQAMSAFRQRFMFQEIFIHGNHTLTQFERDSYFGGRTEAFFIGKIPTEKVYCVDVNSMYPAVMKKHKIPYKFIEAHNEVSISKLKQLMKRYFCIAQIAISTDKNCYPLKKDGKLIFPTGRFITTLPHPELELSLNNHDIVMTYNVLCYKSSTFFKYYVNYFHSLRNIYKDEKNEVFSYLTKIIMNSLYGKFGQRMDDVFIEYDAETSEYNTDYLMDVDTGQRYKQTQVGTKVKVAREGVKESFNSFPAICAAVTSYARVLLLEYMEICGKNNYYYCDTDSLFVNETGLKNLSKHIIDNKLGKLSMDKTGSEVIIHGPKDYVWDGKETIKGISKLAVKKAEGVYDCLQFPGMKAELNRGLSEEYQLRKVTKRLKRQYNKGEVSKLGYVHPYCLNEF